MRLATSFSLDQPAPMLPARRVDFATLFKCQWAILRLRGAPCKRRMPGACAQPGCLDSSA
jgi:hypothetical protein